MAENLHTLYVIGPPGAGKTTFIRRQVETWRDRGEYAPADIVLTSFTRAAAAVLAGQIPVPPDHIATLHALCYRGLGHPPLAEGGALRKQWDAECAAAGLGIYQIAATPDLEDEGVYRERVSGDAPGAMLAAYSLWRSTGRVNLYLEEYTRAFAVRWEAFKADTGSIDFTDMLELGLHNLEVCPGAPAVLAVDEAQDLSPLQWQIIDRWGARCERVMVAGDPAQSLYGWLGASPERLLASPGISTTGDQRRVLSQSYRLSPEIQQYAESWLSLHSPPMMEGRTYRARSDGSGQVTRSAATWEHPDELMRLLDSELSEGRRVMILASCSYMLRPTIKLLRETGIRYHNPYRRKAGAWNPGSPQAHTAALSYLVGPMGDTWWSWGEHLPAKFFGGTKKAAAAMSAAWALTEEAYQRAAASDVPWLRGAMLKNPALDYELSCAQGERFFEEPLVVIGTVHSVKGAEADTVVMFPDLSEAGAAESRGSVQGHDALVRMIYVGLTRSRGDVVLCDPAQRRNAVWWP